MVKIIDISCDKMSILNLVTMCFVYLSIYQISTELEDILMTYDFIKVEYVERKEEGGWMYTVHSTVCPVYTAY